MLFLDGFIISGAVVLMAATAALSKDGVLPKIDLEKQRKKIQNAKWSMVRTANVMSAKC
jgi:hypothetical protein